MTRRKKPSGRELARKDIVVRENFEQELLTAFPELEADLRELREWWGDEAPGLHIVVGNVLSNHVQEVVASGAFSRIERACVFMERMATSPDGSVQNALQVSLLEVLGDVRERLEKARLTMGPATLALSHEIERLWGREN